MGGSEEQMIAMPLQQPAANQRRFVRAIVIHHQMDVEIAGNSSIVLLQEFQELDRAMAPMTLAQDVAGSDIEGGEQTGDTMSAVGVGASFQLSDPHGKHRLGAAQSLGLHF